MEVILKEKFLAWVMKTRGSVRYWFRSPNRLWGPIGNSENSRCRYDLSCIEVSGRSFGLGFR